MPRPDRIHPLPVASSFNEEILQNQPMDTVCGANSGKFCNDCSYLIPMPRYPWGLGSQIRHGLHGRLYSAPFWLLPLLYVHSMPKAQSQLGKTQFPAFLTNNIKLSIVCNSGADLLLAVLPSYIFWDLKLKPMIKFSLMILTSLGLV